MSVPSTTTPSNPYDSARSATCSVANSRCVGVEYAHWLLSQTKTTGSLRTPASVIASWQSPRADAPSPNQPTATRFSSRMRNASAQPTATGSIAGRGLTAAIRHSFDAALREDPPRLHAAHDVDAHVAVQPRAGVIRAHRRGNADGRALVAAAGVER